MKRLFLLLIFIFLMSITFAESNKVYIVAFKYENGLLEFEDKTIKYGFSPDRKLASGDYRGEIISIDDNTLYSFDFNIPLKQFVDISDIETGEISGGIVKLDNTRFALVLPYYKKAKDIVVYGPDKEKVLTIDVEEKEEFDYLPFSVIALIISLFLIILKIAKKQKKTQRKLYK